MAITEPDASGGLGSYTRDLWGVLTGALSVVAAPALGQLLDINTTAVVGADGNIRYAATPSAEPTAAQQARSALNNPVVLLGIGAVVILGIVLAVRR